MSAQTVTLQRGTTSRTVLVTATASDGGPATGLDPSSVTAGFVRDDGTKGTIEISDGHLGAWSAGSLVEVDRDLTPGVYQLGIPDEVIAGGASRAAVVLQSPDLSFSPIDFDLVAFDPQDIDRIGMEALAFEQRVNCLTTAFPLLAVEERKRLEAQRAAD